MKIVTMKPGQAIKIICGEMKAELRAYDDRILLAMTEFPPEKPTTSKDSEEWSDVFDRLFNKTT